MRKNFFRFAFIVALLLTGLALEAQELDETDPMSTKARQYIETIHNVEKSSPEEEGLSQQEYDKWLGSLYLLLAMEQYHQYQLDDALSAAGSSISYFKKSGDDDYYILASELVADVARFLRKYNIAEAALSDALAVATGISDKDRMVKILLDFYSLANEQKDIDKIHKILIELQTFDHEALGQTARMDLIRHDFDYALSIGDFDLASVYLDEYQSEMESMSDDEKANNMVLFLEYKVKYFDGVGKYDEAIECYERQLSSNAPSISDVWRYVKIIYFSAYAGNDEKFDEYLDKINALKGSAEISDETWLQIHVQLIISLMKLNRFDEAYELVLETERMGVKDEYLLVYKGNVLHKSGRNEEAREAYREYLALCGNLYGTESVKYADALRFLANIEGFCGDIKSGTEHLIESLRLVQSIIRRDLPYITFDRLEEYWNDVSTGITEMAAYSLEAGITQGELTVAAYEGLVMSKGLLLSSEKSFLDYVDDSGDDELQTLYLETIALRDKMETLKKSYGDNREQIIELQPELSLMESALMQYGTGFMDYTGYLNVTYDDLRHSLKKNEVVIDFVNHKSEKFGSKYVAFVYKRDWEAPMLVPVCTQMDLDSYGISSLRPDQIYAKGNSEDMLELLWKPFERYVGKGDVVYFIPSGDIHLIAFDSFQMRDGKLLGSKYDFVRLSSAKELLVGLTESSDMHSAVLYGGLQYDMTEDDMIVEAGKHMRGRRQLVSRGGLRRGGDKFEELPMSAKEVTVVSNLLKTRGVKSICYMGKEGTEESFMELGTEEPSPDILHLATHGFYYTPAEATEIRGLAGYKSAMRLSGIVMAGGNAEWMGKKIPENTLGGILTADDISKCDLSGTDIVVLTACETGKGKVTSEGVYGIQRAFKKAGVQTVIMSLWAADDKASMDFMDYFYTALTSTRWNKRTAFKIAKEQMRENYSSPYYWAGFFMLD